ncbi:MAG: enoyl-CoA hydratase/isomerase family protein [Alphaproteobacteria bacterium]
MNAINLDMWRGIAKTFATLNSEENLRCIILRGSSEKAFAAGTDIAEFKSERFDRGSARTYGTVMAAALDTIQNCRHPVVAMIHGAYVGGGLELACCCDMRICGEGSRFDVSVKNLGWWSRSTKCRPWPASLAARQRWKSPWKAASSAPGKPCGKPGEPRCAR